MWPSDSAPGKGGFHWKPHLKRRVCLKGNMPLPIPAAAPVSLSADCLRLLRAGAVCFLRKAGELFAEGEFCNKGIKEKAL